MKKMLVMLGLAATLVFAQGISQATTLTVYPGWNMVAAPTVPFEPDAANVFAGYEGTLQGWDPAVGGTSYAPPPFGFTNVLLGDGFWLYSDSANAVTLSYNGCPDGLKINDDDTTMTDMWISLPGAGAGTGAYHMVGNPFDHEVSTFSADGKILFTDGTTTLSWEQASSPTYGWVDASFQGWDPTSGGTTVVWDAEDPFSMHSLLPGNSYWINTHKDNIAMIVVAKK